MTAPTAGYGLRRNATQLKHRDSDGQHVVLRKHQDFRFQSALEGVVLCLRGTRFNNLSPLLVFYRSAQNHLGPTASHNIAGAHEFSRLQRRQKIVSGGY